MFVQTEITPNPNSLKFLPGKKVSKIGIIEITKKDETNNELVKNILSEAKMSFSDVVKTSIFLSNMDNFNDVNNVYGSYLNSGEEPARETIAVKTLPMNVNVEISMIAMK